MSIRQKNEAIFSHHQAKYDHIRVLAERYLLFYYHTWLDRVLQMDRYAVRKEYCTVQALERTKGYSLLVHNCLRKYAI